MKEIMAPITTESRFRSWATLSSLGRGFAASSSRNEVVLGRDQP
jgi:hypothetical protein